MIELFDKVKNFILGEPEEEYEEEYNDNYGEEYENEQEVSNGSNVRSFGSGFGGLMVGVSAPLTSNLPAKGFCADSSADVDVIGSPHLGQNFPSN